MKSAQQAVTQYFRFVPRGASLGLDARSTHSVGVAAAVSLGVSKCFLHLKAAGNV